MECRLCGTEVSQNARGCPRCGLRPPRSGWSTMVLVLGVLAIVVVSAVAGLAIYRHREAIIEWCRHGPEPDAAPPPPPAPAPLEVTSDRLHLDYAANEVAADQRYRGRLLRVTGAVKAIRRVLDSPYLDLWTTDEFYNVTAYFGMEWAGRLARVKVGDHVAVQCIGAGESMGPRLRECILE